MVWEWNASDAAKSVKIGYIFIRTKERTSHTRKSETEEIPKHPKYLWSIITVPQPNQASSEN